MQPDDDPKAPIKFPSPAESHGLSEAAHNSVLPDGSDDPNAHLRLTEMEKNVLATRFEESKERVKKFNYHMDRLIKLGLDEFRDYQDTMDFAPRFRDHLVDAQLLITNAKNFLIPLPPKKMVERILAKQKHDAEMAKNGGDITVPKPE